MSFEGAVSSLGKTRDDDGTVDRVADPPQKMWAVLAAFKYKCEVENIELVSVFEVRAHTPSLSRLAFSLPPNLRVLLLTLVSLHSHENNRRAAATTLAR